jgi:hypothetical protein
LGGRRGKHHRSQIKQERTRRDIDFLSIWIDPAVVSVPNRTPPSSRVALVVRRITCVGDCRRCRYRGGLHPSAAWPDQRCGASWEWRSGNGRSSASGHSHRHSRLCRQCGRDRRAVAIDATAPGLGFEQFKAHDFIVGTLGPCSGVASCYGRPRRPERTLTSKQLPPK